MRLLFKLLGFFIPVALILCLAGFNIDNRSNISFVFIEFNNVPVFITIIVSFCVGMLFSFPLTFYLFVTKVAKNAKKKKTIRLKNEVAAAKKSTIAATQNTATTTQPSVATTQAQEKNSTQVENLPKMKYESNANVEPKIPHKNDSNTNENSPKIIY